MLILFYSMRYRITKIIRVKFIRLFINFIICHFRTFCINRYHFYKKKSFQLKSCNVKFSLLVQPLCIVFFTASLSLKWRIIHHTPLTTRWSSKIEKCTEKSIRSCYVTKESQLFSTHVCFVFVNLTCLFSCGTGFRRLLSLLCRLSRIFVVFSIFSKKADLPSSCRIPWCQCASKFPSGPFKLDQS